MTKTKVRTTSGSVNGITESTRAENREAKYWLSQSVTVKVSSSSRGDRIALINERLRGNASRTMNTTE